MQRLINFIIQFVYKQVLYASYDTEINRLKANLFSKLFHLIRKLGEPLIQYEVAGFSLLLPFSHQLPFILKTYPHYSCNLARIAKLVIQKYKNFKFIDVGANIGDSIALLKKESNFPILCIEGDEQFFSILEKNAAFFSDITLAKAYLGDSNKNLRGTTFKNGGTAHLRESDTEENIIEVKKISEVLKDYPLFWQSKMIKVDTDGFDCKILRGAVDFLTSAKPVIFFEYDPFLLAEQGDDGISIFKYFSELGYYNLLIYDNFGDLILSTELDRHRLLQEIHLYFSGRLSHRYCDICVFHAEDNDLFEIVREQEMQFFETIRGQRK
jgi:FkbM family methyltransferase